MRLGLDLDSGFELLCPCCGQSLTGERAKQNEIDVALYGATASYGVCVHCWQPVGSLASRDPEYRKRWRKAKEALREAMRAERRLHGRGDD